MANTEFQAQPESQVGASSTTPAVNESLFNSAYGSAVAPQGNAAITQAAPVGESALGTAATSAMTSDQALLTFASLNQTDMSAFFNALTVQEQSALNAVLAVPNPTEAAISQVFAQIPQADLQTAFAAVPASDLQAAMTAAANPQTDALVTSGTGTATDVPATGTATSIAGSTDAPASPAVIQPADVTKALQSLTADQATQLLGSLNQADSAAFTTALTGADQQQLSSALSGSNITEAQVSNALAALPQADVVAAFSAVPTADLQAGLKELSSQTSASSDNTKPDASDSSIAKTSDNGSQSSTANKSSSGAHLWIEAGVASIGTVGGIYAAQKYGPQLAETKFGAGYMQVRTKLTDGAKSLKPDFLSRSASRSDVWSKPPDVSGLTGPDLADYEISSSIADENPKGVWVGSVANHRTGLQDGFDVVEDLTKAAEL